MTKERRQALEDPKLAFALALDSMRARRSPSDAMDTGAEAAAQYKAAIERLNTITDQDIARVGRESYFCSHNRLYR